MDQPRTVRVTLTYRATLTEGVGGVEYYSHSGSGHYSNCQECQSNFGLQS